MSSDDEIVLGIDLGTTFSAVAVVNSHGKSEIVPNAEGGRTTPSVVHFYEQDGCVVGDEAVKMVVEDPDNCIRFIKRHMGEESYRLELFDRPYTPQEISAIILRKLKDDSEEALGRPVRDAVITVPAYFHSAQRGATAEAGAIAGLNVLSIINEPTAAAIAYGLDRIGGQRKLLVLDLGGGTFDVTVMEIKGTKLSTLASDGNAELGGKDWDDRLLDYVADQFVATHGADPRDEPAPYQELYERVLQAKIALSTKESALVPVNYMGRRHAVRVERRMFEDLTRDLVQQCEDTANLVVEKAALSWPDLDEVLLVGGSTRMPMIRNLLYRLSQKDPAEGVNPDECVALGAALAGVFRHRPRHPALLEKRAAITSRAATAGPAPERPAPPRQNASNLPRGAVIGLAAGGHVAAEVATELAQETEATDVASDPAETGALLPDGVPSADGLDDVTIEDATTHPLGIVVLDRDRSERVVELIPEGTRLPYEFRGRFAYAYENMTAVRVEVTEGAGTRRDEVTVIGVVELTGLPPRPRGTPIEVVYRYGIDQILAVVVVDVTSGVSRKVDIRFQGGLTQDEVMAARGRNKDIQVD